MRAFPIAALGSFPGIGFNRPSGTYPPPRIDPGVETPGYYRIIPLG